MSACTSLSTLGIEAVSGRLGKSARLLAADSVAVSVQPVWVVRTYVHGTSLAFVTVAVLTMATARYW